MILRKIEIAGELEKTLRRLTAIRLRAAADYRRANAVGDFMADLSVRQAELLRLIADLAPCSLSQVAAAGGVTKGSASVAVKTLVRKGFLRMNRHPGDRRTLVIELDAGIRGHLERIDGEFNARLAEAWSRCDELILDELYEHLCLLNRGME